MYMVTMVTMRRCKVTMRRCKVKAKERLTYRGVRMIREGQMRGRRPPQTPRQAPFLLHIAQLFRGEQKCGWQDQIL